MSRAFDIHSFDIDGEIPVKARRGRIRPPLSRGRSSGTPGASTLLLALVVALGSASWGCWTTKQEGEALRRDVEDLKARLAKTDERNKRERIKLQKVMEKATALLTRNSADIGAQVERIQNQQLKLTGKQDELAMKVAKLEKLVMELKGKLEAKEKGTGAPGEPIPNDPAEIMKKAEARISEGYPAQARTLLKALVKKFPESSLVPKAYRLMGDSYFDQQKYAPAIVMYKKVLEKTPVGPEAAEATFKIGLSFYQLKFCSDADVFLSDFLAKNRKHTYAKRARKLRRLIRRYRKNPAFCR